MTDPLQDFLSKFQYVSTQQMPFVEELSEKEANNVLQNEDDSIEENISVSSSISIEEDIPDFFTIEEGREFQQQGLVPESLIRDSIYGEFSKETEIQRNKLLLYHAIYETNKEPKLDWFSEEKKKFEEIERKVLWDFYKLLHPSVDYGKEFEELILDKIFQSKNPRLFAYHFRLHSKSGVDDMDNNTFWNYIYSDECILENKEKDEKDYRDLVHSIFYEHFN